MLPSGDRKKMDSKVFRRSEHCRHCQGSCRCSDGIRFSVEHVGIPALETDFALVLPHCGRAGRQLSRASLTLPGLELERERTLPKEYILIADGGPKFWDGLCPSIKHSAPRSAFNGTGSCETVVDHRPTLQAFCTVSMACKNNKKIAAAFFIPPLCVRIHACAMLRAPEASSQPPAGRKGSHRVPLSAGSSPC